MEVHGDRDGAMHFVRYDGAHRLLMRSVSPGRCAVNKAEPAQ
jgi:hypothetical protein